MKNLFTRLMLVAVAAMGFVACQEGYEDVTITPEAKEIVMTFVAEAPDTRTSVAIDGNAAKYSWSKGDKVGFYYVANDVDYKKKGNSEEAVIADDGTTATFTASFTPTDGASSYNIGAFYPGTSWMSHTTENPFNNVKVKISNEQALTVGSFDPTADLMMSKPFMDVALEEDVKTLEFTRIAAIGKMNLKLTDMVEGEVIKSVKFTLAEGHFNGPVVLDLENSTYELGTTGTSNYVNLTGSLAANADDRTAIFFTCFPGEYSGAYTIEVETDKATYSKEGTLKTALVFTAGDVLNFNATVGDRAEVEIPTDVYTLLKDVKELNAGDKIIIAAAGYDYALSTTQNSNNRGQASITKSEDRSTISYGADVQILTVEPGTTTGTFAFNTGSGYLYAASASNNYLRTETTLSDNSSWKIEISGGPDFIASIVAQGTNTRNNLKFNNSNNPKIFSCYSSGQDDVAIYYLDGEPDTTPRFTVTPTEKSIGAKGGDIQFTVTAYNGAVVSAESSADWLTMTIDNTTFKATVDANDTTESRSATITFSADGCEDVFVTVSQAAQSTGEEESATLSFENTAQRTSYSTTQQVWAQNGITFTNNKGDSTTNVADYANPVRLYASSEVIVEYSNMKKIEFTCGTSSYATALKNSIGTVDGVTVTVSSSLVTVEFNENVSSFTIAKLTAQVRLKSLTVYTE